MADLSLRGLDAATLARIRSSARRLNVSVNRLILETLQRQYGPAPRARDAVDRLAGTWTKAEADEFDRAIADFSRIDPEMWAGEERASYRVKRSRKRP